MTREPTNGRSVTISVTVIMVLHVSRDYSVLNSSTPSFVDYLLVCLVHVLLQLLLLDFFYFITVFLSLPLRIPS